MEVARPEFLPEESLSREEMEEMQHEIAGVAIFENRIDFAPADLATDRLVAGIDQAFLDDGQRAISAVVLLQDGDVIERTYAVTPLSIPYIPGLLAFREGGPIVEALRRLETEPDVLMLDGSGRIHYRQAGLATHIGVCFDVPAVGVAKRLLCGRSKRSIESLSEGERVPIEADDEMTASAGEIVGYAYQSRQYPNSTEINPLYVSPGHRLSAATAVDCVAATGGTYKLPEPTRLADQYADERKTTLGM